MNAVTRSARKATRDVTAGAARLRNLKIANRRRNRRAVRHALAAGRFDLAGVERRVTAYDVS